jgi:chemotaxis protein MotB
MKRSVRNVFSAVAVVVAAASIGCGYSEDEWQAQLAKNKQCNSDLEGERAAKKQMETDLANLKKEIGALKQANEATGAKAADLQKALAAAEARAKALEAMKARLEALKKKLDELKKFGIDTKIRNGLITIVMPGDVLFAPGKETLSKEGKDVLAKIAGVIRDNPDLSKRHFQIVGHTDNAPYVGPFKDNVGLSVMRAREVYEFLSTDPAKAKKGKPGEGGGLDAKNLSAAGFGDLDPVAGTREQQSADERKTNRRVEIAILPNADELMKLDV